MSNEKTPKSLYLFYILVIYVFIQFIWWSYLLFDLNTKIYTNTDELEKKWMMIAGEGLVFLCLMIYGVIRIRLNMKRESELARRQKNFLLSVTHELKSPIASIKLIFETIQKRDLEKSRLNEIAGNGNKDAERLNTLVENILLSTQIDNNSFRINKEKINFSDYVTDEINKLQQTSGRKFETKISEKIFLPIDRFNFHSILSNLVENAIKYSEEKSIIRVILNKKNKSIVLSIVDEGIGVDEVEKEKIFEKFYRSGNEDTRNTKGTGLGLYIVKQLTELHNGKITVKNNLPKGSIFEIIFESEE